MRRGLAARFTLYNSYLAARSLMAAVQIDRVDINFKRNLPSNDLEISQMINNLDGIVDRETLVSQLSFVTDAAEIVRLAEDETKPGAPPPARLAEPLPPDEAV